MFRLLRFLFRRRQHRYMPGIVQYQSFNRRIAWVVPSGNYPIMQVGEKVLRRSGMLRNQLRPGDRVCWDARYGTQPRRLYWR